MAMGLAPASMRARAAEGARAPEGATAADDVRATDDVRTAERRVRRAHRLSSRRHSLVNCLALAHNVHRDAPLGCWNRSGFAHTVAARRSLTTSAHSTEPTAKARRVTPTEETRAIDAQLASIMAEVGLGDFEPGPSERSSTDHDRSREPVLEGCLEDVDGRPIVPGGGGRAAARSDPMEALFDRLTRPPTVDVTPVRTPTSAPPQALGGDLGEGPTGGLTEGDHDILGAAVVGEPASAARLGMTLAVGSALVAAILLVVGAVVALGPSSPATVSAGALVPAAEGNAATPPKPRDWPASLQSPLDTSFPAPPGAGNVHGVVVVNVTVDPEGRPTRIRAISGPQRLRRAAERLAATWSYLPAIRSGERVTSDLQVSVTLGGARDTGEGSATRP
ncbi:MAG: energy transducer TonB [Vicinamibacterales bacterium]